MLFLTTHLWLAAILLLGIATLIAMAGPVIIRRQVTLDKLKVNNEVAGFKFAVIGVLYAVQLAFVVIVVWGKWADAERYVTQEGTAAATIYRLAAGIGAESGTVLREATTNYLTVTIAQDWPAMERGEASAVATRALDNVYSKVLVRTGDRRDTALLTEVLQQLDNITSARRARLDLASGIVPGIIWLGLFGGAAITIGFCLFLALQISAHKR